MQLFTSTKEAKTLQAALAEYIAKSGTSGDTHTAQELLARIAKCLELQDTSSKK